MPLAHHLICNAHKRDGTQCGMVAVRGRTKCRMHGGKTLSGMASGTYRHGGYSKSLPARYAQHLEEAEKDPRLFSMRKDAAACRARLHELFERLDSGESGAVWKRLGETHAAFEAALAGGDTSAMRQQLAAMQALIGRGLSDYAAWADVRATWDSLCQLTATEQKTLVAMQQVMSYEQVALYFGVIANAVKQAVTEHADPGSSRKILTALESEFTRLTVLDGA